MTDRLELIAKEIPKCKVFADIGCDHGYITKALLDRGICERAIITDISEKCLNKAKELLNDYIIHGVVESRVCDGLDGVVYSDLALIAGMGGEEIVKIISSCKNLPNSLVLQPMKNCDKVRTTLISLGYKIVKDFVFKAENKFYDLIVCIKGEDSLTDDEIVFGRTNLLTLSPDFIERLKYEAKKIDRVLDNPDLKEKDKLSLLKKKEELLKYVKA